jgi:hypothetical protein
MATTTTAADADAEIIDADSEVIDEGGPAFPIVETDEQLGSRVWPGMSLRQWYVGQAIAGLSAGKAMRAPECIAALAIAVADETILQLNEARPLP